MPICVVSGGNIFYETDGDAAQPAILFIHGWLMNRHFWQSTVAELSDRFYCITVDLLGMGDSDLPADADFSPQAHAQRMVELMDRLEIERFVVIGHSMGGWIGGYLAAKMAPQRVTHFVSVSGLVTGQVGLGVRLRQPITWLGGKIPALVSASGWLARIQPVAWMLHGRLMFYDMWALPRSVWYDGQRSIYSAKHATTHLATMRELNTKHDVTADLPNIRAKTLAITGMQDQVVYATQQAILAEKVPGATHVLVDECGHQPNHECFDEYRQALATFLADVTA